MTLRNLDKLIIVIVAAIVLMWVFRRCSGRSAASVPPATTQTAPGTTPVANTQNQGTTATATSQPTAAPVTSSTPPAPKPTSSAPVAQPKSTGTTMYVVIDSMKLRKEPTLDGQVLQLMRKGDGVTLNGERSKNIYKLKIDDVTYQEPWIKVTTKSGKTGWIYGAGLRAYKK